MTTVKPNLQVNLLKLKKWWGEEGVLKCTLPFQRRAGVWNSVTKSYLVWSVLSGKYVSPIILLRDEAGAGDKGKDSYVYEILDGQQRLTSLFGFMDDGWGLGDETPPVKFDGFIFDIAGKKFSELEEELQAAIGQFKIPVQCFENYTMEEAETLFFGINSGVSLSSVQKSKAKMGSDMIAFFSGLLEGAFFTNAVHITAAQERREEKLQMLLQSALLLDNRHDGFQYHTISAAFCQSYAEGLRDNYGEEHKSMLKEAVDYLDGAFQSENRFLRKNNVPIVVVVAKVAAEHGVKENDFRLFLNEFASSVYPAYDRASGSGNVKAKMVQMRLRVMFLAFCKYFGLDASKVRKPFAEEIPLYDGIVKEDGLLPDGFGEPERDENVQTNDAAASLDGVAGDEAENASEGGKLDEEA